MIGDDLELGEPVLPAVRSLHGSTEEMGHEVHSVADPEHRKAEVEDRGVGPNGVGFEHARRSAGEHEPDRVVLLNLLRGKITANDDGLDTKLPQTTSDKLRILGTEIEDENDFVLHIRPVPTVTRRIPDPSPAGVKRPSPDPRRFG